MNEVSEPRLTSRALRVLAWEFDLPGVWRFSRPSKPSKRDIEEYEAKCRTVKNALIAKVDAGELRRDSLRRAPDMGASTLENIEDFLEFHGRKLVGYEAPEPAKPGQPIQDDVVIAKALANAMDMASWSQLPNENQRELIVAAGWLLQEYDIIEKLP